MRLADVVDEVVGELAAAGLAAYELGDPSPLVLPAVVVGPVRLADGETTTGGGFTGAGVLDVLAATGDTGSLTAYVDDVLAALVAAPFRVTSLDPATLTVESKTVPAYVLTIAWEHTIKETA